MKYYRCRVSFSGVKSDGKGGYEMGTWGAEALVDAALIDQDDEELAERHTRFIEMKVGARAASCAARGNFEEGTAFDRRIEWVAPE